MISLQRIDHINLTSSPKHYTVRFLIKPSLHFCTIQKIDTKYGTTTRTQSYKNPNNHLIAAIVPDFPRFLDRVQDFIAKDVPTLPGFNGNDEARLLIPDIVNPSNIYFLLLVLSLAVAFLYWEGGDLLRDYSQERELEELEENFRTESPNAEKIEKKDQLKQDRIYKERKRGLAWLAIITSIAIFSTGIVNTINPFQP